MYVAILMERQTAIGISDKKTCDLTGLLNNGMYVIFRITHKLVQILSVCLMIGHQTFHGDSYCVPQSMNEPEIGYFLHGVMCMLLEVSHRWSMLWVISLV